MKRLASTVHRLPPGGDRWELELASIQVRFGAGRMAELPEAVLAAGGRQVVPRHVLLVTDPGLRQAGHARRAVDLLESAGLGCTVVADVEHNPTDCDLRRAARGLAGDDVDLIVALGGGSVLDAAKGLNFLLTSGGRLEDYWGYGKANRPLLPAVAVPTTGGTGSDAQSYALISQDGTNRKMACGDPSARFREVILDPELALSVPAGTVAATGMDALSHALESHVTKTRTDASAALSLEAWRILDANLESCFDEAADQLLCRGAMLAGAHLAGAAIEASMLGAAHAAANPLTARFGVTHGVAIGLMLPAVIRFNAQVADDHYRELHEGGGEAIARRVEGLRDAVGLPGRLGEHGLARESLPELAQQATREWTGTHNPRPVSAADFLDLYEAAW